MACRYSMTAWKHGTRDGMEMCLFHMSCGCVVTVYMMYIHSIAMHAVCIAYICMSCHLIPCVLVRSLHGIKLYFRHATYRLLDITQHIALHEPMVGCRCVGEGVDRGTEIIVGEELVQET